MNRLTLDQVRTAVVRLPALPAAVQQVLASFADDDADLEPIVTALGHDQALSARVLRLANSSFYGLQTKVATLNEAVVVLGFSRLRSTVAAVAAAGCFTDRHLPGFDFRNFWRHCAAVGIAARLVAERTRRPAEVAFLAGLLHDIGLLVLLSSFPTESAAVLDYARREHCLIVEAERQVIGIDHERVGDLIAERWHFPPTIREGIAAHHGPDALSFESLASVVHLADAVVHAMGISDPVEELVPPLSDRALDRLGLDSVDLRRIMAAVDHCLDSTWRALLA